MRIKKELKIIGKTLIIGKSAYKGIKGLVKEQTANAFNYVEPTDLFASEAITFIKDIVDIFL